MPKSLPLSDFCGELAVEHFSFFHQLMLAHCGQKQSFVHDRRLAIKGASLGYLKNYSRWIVAGLVTTPCRPGLVGPEKRMRFRLLLFRVSFALPMSVNFLKQKQADTLAGHQLCKRDAYHLFRFHADEPAKGWIYIAEEHLSATHYGNGQTRRIENCTGGQAAVVGSHYSILKGR